MHGKIILLNLGILLGYMVGLTIASGAGVLFVSVYFIGLHILINLLLSIIRYIEKKSDAGVYLLSALLILLIGFPSCWGLSTVAGGPPPM